MMPRRLRYEELHFSIRAQSPLHDPTVLYLALSRTIDDIPFTTQYVIDKDALNLTKKQFEDFCGFMGHICKNLSMELAYFIQNKLQAN